MGKAVKSITKGAKKAVKKVGKVASGALKLPIDLAGGAVKTVGGLAGDLLGPLTGADAIAEADKNAQRIAEQQRQAAEEQATLARNLSADLGIDNTAQVEAGGTADALAERRRRRPAVGSSVASSIGLNV